MGKPLSIEDIIEITKDIRGWCEPPKMALLCTLAREAKVIVELGLYQGKSFVAMMLINPEAHIFGVDEFNLDGEGEAIETAFKANLQKLHLEPAGVYKMTTAEAAKIFNKSIDLLHIDASHRYDQVVADIENWIPKITLGGVVVFDDYGPPRFPEVQKAVDEWRNEKWLEIGRTELNIAFRRIC